MDDFLASPVTVEVAHAQSPPADLVAGHVGPAVAQGTTAPARNRQGNVVVQGGNPAGPTGKARAPGANAAARSRSAAEKVGKVSGVKRKKIPTKRTAPSSTPFAPARGSPAMPFNGAASTASEVFDEMTGRYASSVPSIFFAFRHCGNSCLVIAHYSGGSNNATVEFMNLLDTNAVDIDQVPFAAFDYNETEGGMDDHGGEEELEEIDEGRMSKRKQEKARDQRTTQSWKIKS